MATMASSTGTARDMILKTPGRDSLTAVAARTVPVTKNHHLPTPPNSISPNLPAYGLEPRGHHVKPAQADLANVDSDLDLREDHERRTRDGHTQEDHDIVSTAYDATGNITPNLLARHHLPDILLNHGPLPIRHIMGYLHTSVPGFSGIPPTKARRLVVGALEGRGNGGAMGGLNGDVQFEKVGWGRWDAKIKGQSTLRGNRQITPSSHPSSYADGMPIAGAKVSFDRTRLAPESWTGDSTVFSHDEDDMDIMMDDEDEADKMSLDGDVSDTSSEAPPEDETMDDDPDDVTDDEDWAAVGAAALRAASYSNSGPRNNLLAPHLYTGGSYGGGGPSLSSLAKSVPVLPSLQQRKILNFSEYGMASASQEREAIEALLQLGSV